MKNSLFQLFYAKKNKADQLGRANIYLRITEDGKRTEPSMQLR